MYKIVINSEIHLHQCLFESRGFKSGISSAQWKRGAQWKRKKILENFARLTGKYLCPSPTQVFPCQLYQVFENNFLQDTSRQLLLMNTLDGQKIYVCVTSFSQFTTLQCSSGIMTIFWCNEERFLIKKTWLNSNSQTLSLTLFQR